MNFRAWTRHLTARGLRILAPSHPVPVELWAVLPAGDVVHFRCRGTGASLERYAAADVGTVVPADGCDCGCAHHVTGAVTTRVQPRPAARPREVRRYDGRAERGWTSYEAGLLSVADAAELFDDLLDALSGEVPAVPAPSQPAHSQPAFSLAGQPGSGPVATGRVGSVVQSDQEPTYSAAGSPALASASTS